MRQARFFVAGKPVPKGSMTPIRRKDGGVFMKHQNSDGLRSWTMFIKDEAVRAWDGNPSALAIEVGVAYYFTRPNKHYRTGKFSHLLKPDAPKRMTEKPDIDKLNRAVLDALTHVCFLDDKQVFGYAGSPQKCWLPAQDQIPGVAITVAEYDL